LSPLFGLWAFKSAILPETVYIPRPTRERRLLSRLIAPSPEENRRNRARVDFQRTLLPRKRIAVLVGCLFYLILLDSDGFAPFDGGRSQDSKPRGSITLLTAVPIMSAVTLRFPEKG
jgi:hypothetical protein